MCCDPQSNGVGCYYWGQGCSRLVEHGWLAYAPWQQELLSGHSSSKDCWGLKQHQQLQQQGDSVRQQWWPSLMVRKYLSVRVIAGTCPVARTRVEAICGHRGRIECSGCQCAFTWLQDLAAGTCTAVGTGDQSWGWHCSGVQLQELVVGTCGCLVNWQESGCSRHLNSCRRLEWCYAYAQPHIPVLAAGMDLGAQGGGTT